MIRHISDHKVNVVFILWGKFAQEKQVLIDETKHHVLKAAHLRLSPPIKASLAAAIFLKQISYWFMTAWTRSTGHCMHHEKIATDIFARIWALWGLISFVATFLLIFIPSMISYLFPNLPASGISCLFPGSG